MMVCDWIGVSPWRRFLCKIVMFCWVHICNPPQKKCWWDPWFTLELSLLCDLPVIRKKTKTCRPQTIKKVCGGGQFNFVAIKLYFKIKQNEAGKRIQTKFSVSFYIICKCNMYIIHVHRSLFLSKHLLE